MKTALFYIGTFVIILGITTFVVSMFQPPPAPLTADGTAVDSLANTPKNDAAQKQLGAGLPEAEQPKQNELAEAAPEKTAEAETPAQQPMDALESLQMSLRQPNNSPSDNLEQQQLAQQQQKAEQKFCEKMTKEMPDLRKNAAGTGCNDYRESGNGIGSNRDFKMNKRQPPK
ncbi:MAG: hypothetical protein R3C26_15295 [Calditrichia bacterium]